MGEAVVVNRPCFSDISVDAIEPTLEQHLAECRAVVEKVSQVEQPTWESVMQPLDEAHNRLSLFWSPISHLNSVMNSEALREIHKRCLKHLSIYYTELGQNRKLYNASLALQNSTQFSKLNSARKQQILHSTRDFELSGVSLDEEEKKRFADIESELTALAAEFSDNVLDATDAWSKLVVNVEDLDGLPESTVAAARERAAAKGQDGYLLNLEFPCYLAVITFAKNASLREQMYTAYSTRASDQGPHAGQFDNSKLMNTLLGLRAEKAKLLGYPSYAHLSVVPKMVQTPEQVLEFINDLAERAVPAAKKEYSQLQAFAKEELKIEQLNAWDIAYVSDKLKKARFDVSDEELKPYFPADKAIPGMFAVVEKLFNMNIEPVPSVDVYHPDVQLYRITDHTGEVRGEFYLDNYARENKRGGAWMDVCATRQLTQGAVQRPIAYLTCNLTAPVGKDPALLTHMEVTTLFHEFGHGLHHLLTQVDAAGVSGINGVEWDAVELPSQFLENWCWERESIDMISGHYETGDPLPDDLYNKMNKARHFQSAMQLVRQLEFALFDMQLHLQATATHVPDIQAVLDSIREQVSVVPVPAYNRFQHSFSHIFAGGYSAGYFSYQWAEVLSADAFSRFEEEGIFNQTTGREFLESILEVGGSRDAISSFKAFRGREPTVDALLKKAGLAA
ncbi:MAG: M3 family metallopeptidase [Granulosicoccus sp.]|nr:M3 family metallopeptidase [Granulosicoccus sp.]